MSNANEPAFPRTAADPEWGNGTESFEGLTKREYFAGVAMQAALAYGGEDRHQKTAADCVQFADALLAELSKPAT